MSGIWISAGIFGAVFLLTSLAETVLPLRRRVEPRLRRTVRNLSTGALSLAVVTLLQAPLLTPVAAWCERHGVGLLRVLGLPRAIETGLAILLFDYTLWHWHRINHRVPFFWRFHLVHHVDRDMDASTGVRFHFGEMALSVGWRALQVAAIGPPALGLWLYQVLLASSVLFHHSNTRLPVRIERALVRFIVTPRMHGIHHSDWRNETDSNWSSLLSVWDVLHRTLRLNVSQSEVVVGVPAYRDPSDVTLPRILSMPFRRQKKDWAGPDGLHVSRSWPDDEADTLAP
jgi:sterol desaturase/sphingolipid hydroxylase (fatty acid hydroxylase superfamily)